MKLSLVSHSQQSSKKTVGSLLCLLFLFMVSAFAPRMAHAVTVKVTYTDSATTGFNDATTYGTTTLGAARKSAFEATLSYWSTQLGPSAVDVNVDAAFTAQGGSSTGAVLAYASPATFMANFTSSNSKFKANTFYPISMANRLAGTDLNGTTVEITARFNSDVDGPTVLGATSFYYGTDGNNGSNIDFFSVALHEVGHGLGFTGLIGSTGAIGGSYPAIYDTYLTQGSDASRLRLTAATTTQAQRAAAIKSNNLFFDGPRTTIANGGSPAKIYSPITYEGGSSTYHLDEATFSLPNPNELMTPASSGVAHAAGPVGLGIFSDMAWSVPTQVVSITRADTNPTSSYSTRFTVTFATPVTGVDAKDFLITKTGSVSGGTITSVSGSGNTYTVTVSNTGGSGTLRLDLVDDDSIVDSDSVPLGGVGTTIISGANGSFTGQPYTIAPSGTFNLFAVNLNNSNVVGINTNNNAQSVYDSTPYGYGVVRASDGTLYSTSFANSTITKVPVSGGTPSILPITGTNLLSNPLDIVIGPDGFLYVSNYGGGSTYSIVKVNPSTGAQTSVSSGGSLNLPTGLAFGTDNQLYVANANTGVVLKVDPTSGTQTTYKATGVAVWGIAFGTDGSLYGTNNSGSTVIKVAPTTLAITTIASAGSLSSPQGIAFGSDGNLYVASNGNSSIVRVTTSGTQTLISSGTNLNSTSDVTTGTITAPTLSVNSTASVIEGNSGTSSLNFTVNLSGPSLTASTVTATTVNGTATSGSDYVALPATIVTFPAGSTTQTVTVQVNGDTLPEADETFTLNLTNPSNATAGTTTTATGTILNDDSGSPSSVNISEFRLSGPNGARDEYIELANMTSSPLSLNGWTLTADTVTTVLSGLTLTGKTIPAYGHLLITNSGGYSLGTVYPSTYMVANATPSAFATGDVQYTGDIALGSALTLANGSTIVDSVGDLSATTGLVSTNQYAFVRRQDGASPVNTNGQQNDFNLVDTASTNGPPTSYGVSTLANGARLGTPSPQNSAGPVNRAALTLVPISIPGTIPEGRYVTKNSPVDPLGRLSLRRTITNNTNQTITQIRFTLVRTTSGTNTDTSIADLRALSSTGVLNAQGVRVVQGIQIEAPTTPVGLSASLSPATTGNGGGLNSSWNVGSLPAGGLAPGQSMNVEFLFGIVRDGNYSTSVVATVAP